jgi:hypothetical protein
MNPGTLPADRAPELTHTCAECGGLVLLLGGEILPRPCGHNSARVRAHASAHLRLHLTATRAS